MLMWIGILLWYCVLVPYELEIIYDFIISDAMEVCH
jgi:hypothetical protein